MTQSNRLPALAAEIAKAHAAAEAAHLTAAQRAIEAGHALIEAKALIAHGGWLPFFAGIGIGARTAQKYMKLAASGLKCEAASYLGGINGALRYLKVRDEMIAALAAVEQAYVDGQLEAFANDIPLDPMALAALPKHLNDFEEATDLLGELLAELDALLPTKSDVIGATGAAQ